MDGSPEQSERQKIDHVHGNNFLSSRSQPVIKAALGRIRNKGMPKKILSDACPLKEAVTQEKRVTSLVFDCRTGFAKNVLLR